MSHSATFWTPIDVWPVDFPVDGVHAFATSGTPSDCVCVALNAVLPFRPDNVFCGINEGYNIASSIQYSGTCGAAFEAANQGCHTIAFSEYHEGAHEVTGKYIEEIASVLIDKPLGKNEIWNINFPGCTLEECRGVKYDCSVSQDQFFSGGYNVVKKDGSKITYMIDYVPSWDAEEGTDLRAVIDNYVAVGKVRNYS
jgi:5'-nucleotidase